VFLVVTGGEALYADLGHFGRKPIQTARLCLVLPALLINYFGQSAEVLADPMAIENPFYRLVLESFLLPMVVLATAATVIGMPAWQDHLSIALARSASDATDFFQIPTGRVVEVGTQVTV
jgi:K+ transporter